MPATNLYIILLL